MLNARQNPLIERSIHCSELFDASLPKLRWYQLSALISQWQQRAQQRRELERLPEHLLKDIGLTQEARLSEISKPFWRA